MLSVVLTKRQNERSNNKATTSNIACSRLEMMQLDKHDVGCLVYEMFTKGVLSGIYCKNEKNEKIGRSCSRC